MARCGLQIERLSAATDGPAIPSRQSSIVNRQSPLGLALLLVLTSVLLVNYALVHPLHNYLEDFRSYYAAGWALRQGLNPYDIDTIHQRLSAAGGLPGKQPIYYYPYPPPTLLLVYLFAALDYPLAQVPWCLFQLGLGLAALVVLCRTLGLAPGSTPALLIATAFLLSSSVHELFRWGQFDMVVLILLSLAVLALSRRASTLGGVLVALAALAKVTPLVCLGVFIVRRDWKALAGSAATLGGLLSAAYLLIGAEGYRCWWSVLTDKLGSLPHLLSPQNMSLHGYVYRALVEQTSLKGPSTPWVNLGPVAAHLAVTLAVAALGLGTVIWMLRRRATLSTAENLAATVPLVLLAAPITWTHHSVTLLVPFAFIVAALARQPRPAWHDLLWVAGIATLWMLRPVQQFELDLSPPLRHLLAPLPTYVAALTWLFMMLRYPGGPGLKTAAAQSRGFAIDDLPLTSACGSAGFQSSISSGAGVGA